MLDVRCKVQDTHHVFAAHSSRLTALSNNTITLPRVWKLNISQGMINLIWQEMITFRGCATVIQNCQLSSTTVIYNCHLQLPSIGQLPSLPSRLLPSRLPITLHDPLHLLSDMRSNKGTGVRVLVLLVHSSDRWSVKGNHFRHVQKQK